MINIWHDIDPSRVTPESFTAVIEIPAGSKKKYELDKQTGLLRLDRILYTSTHYPANYGFIPRTYAGDGDPLDVLVLCSETLDPMVEVDCYPIGVIRMIDDDEIDDKIIAIPFEDPNWTAVRRCANRRCYALVFERDGKLCLNLKCEPMQAQFWRQVYPQVAPGYHMNKTHWNTVTLNAGLDDDALDGMIAHSYDLTAPKERKRR